MVSHSFIRREILALEAHGFEVARIALRGWAEELPDPIDRNEQARTRYVLRRGILPVLIDALGVMVRSPRRTNHDPRRAHGAQVRTTPPLSSDLPR